MRPEDRPSSQWRHTDLAITVPEQGQLVEVRTRAWVVADIEASGLGTPALDPLRPAQSLVTLRSVEDDAEPDETLQVVWEIEPGRSGAWRAGFPKPDHLDDPTLFAAFLDAVRWGSISATNPGSSSLDASRTFSGWTKSPYSWGSDASGNCRSGLRAF